MRYMFPDGSIRKLSRKQAKAEGFKDFKPVYVFIANPKMFANPDETPTYFVTKKATLQPHLHVAKWMKGWWRMAPFAYFCSHDLPFWKAVNISMYLYCKAFDFPISENKYGVRMIKASDLLRKQKIHEIEIKAEGYEE